jgi:hypothetical protein
VGWGGRSPHGQDEGGGGGKGAGPYGGVGGYCRGGHSHSFEARDILQHPPNGHQRGGGEGRGEARIGCVCRGPYRQWKVGAKATTYTPPNRVISSSIPPTVISKGPSARAIEGRGRGEGCAEASTGAWAATHTPPKRVISSSIPPTVTSSGPSARASEAYCRARSASVI